MDLDLDPSQVLEAILTMQMFPLQDGISNPPALGTAQARNNLVEGQVQSLRIDVDPTLPRSGDPVVPRAMPDVLVTTESTPEPIGMQPRSIGRRTELEMSLIASLQHQNLQTQVDPASITITAGLPIPGGSSSGSESSVSPASQPGSCIDPKMTIRRTATPSGSNVIRRTAKDDPNKTISPAQGSSRQRHTAPHKKRRVSAPSRPVRPKAPTRKNSRPPRGHLRYQDRSSPSAREKSKSPSPDDLPPPTFSKLALKALAELDDEIKPIRLVSIRSIDRSKCLTKKQIIGYDPAVPVKDKSIASISCAIEDEKLNPRAQADFVATRARLNVKRDFVKPPENAVTNVVNADMTPKQAEAAIKTSRVAMREAKQTQAMLMYAMDMSHNRPRPSRAAFTIPRHENVYTVRLDKSDAPADGAAFTQAGSNPSSQPARAPPNVTAGTYRDNDSDISHSKDSSLSDGSASVSGSSFNSGRLSTGSNTSSDGSFAYPLSHTVAPPVPAYNFTIPNFSVLGELNTGTTAVLDTLSSSVPLPDNAVSAAPSMTWDAALHQHAANILSTFHMPASTLPGADSSITSSTNASFPTAIPNMNPVQQSAFNTFSFDQLFAPSSISNLPIAHGTFIPSIQTDFLPPPPAPHPSFDATGTNTAIDLHNGIGNPVFPTTRPRAITATGIERLLGSATIADHTCALPEPAMNPCTLYPPGSVIGQQEWLQQQRLVGLINAEPQLLHGTTMNDMVRAPNDVIQINDASGGLEVTAAAPGLSANALGKRKSTEETESGDGWTSAYPPPLPGGRGTKKRGRPRSRSDIPPKPKISLKPATSLGNTSSSAPESAEPVVYGPELPPGVKKDVPIAAPSAVPLRICAPVPRRGVGKSSTQYPFEGSSSTSANCQDSAQLAQASANQMAGQTHLAPPNEDVDSFSTSTTPRPTNQTRMRAATIPAMGGSSFFDLLAQQGGSAQLPATFPSSTMMSAFDAQPTWVPAHLTGVPGPSAAPALSFVNASQREHIILEPGDGRRSSTSSLSGRTSTSGSGTASSTRPGTGMTVASSSSTGSGEIMFVNYGMEDANALRRGVAPSGNYKVPLSAKKRKMP
ncbi:hypothetical protein OC846_001931 [Tilletia horrida]|uniref:Uncharacterized protein n=1 Tax=Tilletia horrida TaxID=155126 RepID=A0AAN6GSY8_9BASI|nr:hypothetical protein OC845_002027 [Tilletia horrida]KAK0554828.1 hypothetical protein OC846_001931 [Tilletia horrida]